MAGYGWINVQALKTFIKSSNKIEPVTSNEDKAYSHHASSQFVCS